MLVVKIARKVLFDYFLSNRLFVDELVDPSRAPITPLRLADVPEVLSLVFSGCSPAWKLK